MKILSQQEGQIRACGPSHQVESRKQGILDPTIWSIMHSTYEFHRPILGHYVNNNNKKNSIIEEKNLLTFSKYIFFFDV